MDSVTQGLLEAVVHAAVGAGIGELLIGGKKLGNRALAWGALFGALPDILDALLSLFLDTASRLLYLRGPTHSLLFIIAAAVGLSFWLRKLWKKDKVTQARAGTLVFLALAAHLLLDACDAKGVKLFSPFVNRPFSLNGLSAIDPFVGLPIVIAILRLAFFAKKDPSRRKWAVRGLVVPAVYLAIGFGAKAWVSSGFDADLQRRQVKVQRRMEAPAALHLLLWRSVVDCGDEFWIGDRSLFDSPSGAIRWVVVPKQRDAFAPIVDLREGKALKEATDGWCVARLTARGVWAADLRLGETRAWEKKGTVDLRPIYAWQWNRGEGPTAGLHRVATDRKNSGENFQQTGQRIVCKRELWDAIPRLAGITGNLPEQLEWKE